MCPTIQCKYTCNLCGLFRISVNIKARTTEDICYYLENIVIPKLMQDHHQRSPNCHPNELTELMIPIPNGTNKIGGVVEN